jgi:hypothetical protein
LIALCAVPLLHLGKHDPVRVATAAGFVYRCTLCGKARPTEEEFFSGNGHVHPERKKFDVERRERERDVRGAAA